MKTSEMKAAGGLPGKGSPARTKTDAARGMVLARETTKPTPQLSEEKSSTRKRSLSGYETPAWRWRDSCHPWCESLRPRPALPVLAKPVHAIRSLTGLNPFVVPKPCIRQKRNGFTLHRACFRKHFLYLRQKQSIGRANAISNNFACRS
jgi:hypothetical protein